MPLRVSRIIPVCVFAFLFVAFSPSFLIAAGSASSAYGNLPLSFEANAGQADPAVRFMASTRNYRVQLSPQQISFLSRTDRVGMKLVNAASDVRLSGIGELEGKTNYLYGDDPSKWIQDVPNYSKVEYSNC